jgi:hypothetical protein
MTWIDLEKNLFGHRFALMNTDGKKQSAVSNQHSARAAGWCCFNRHPSQPGYSGFPGCELGRNSKASLMGRSESKSKRKNKTDQRLPNADGFKAAMVRKPETESIQRHGCVRRDRILADVRNSYPSHLVHNLEHFGVDVDGLRSHAEPLLLVNGAGDGLSQFTQAGE